MFILKIEKGIWYVFKKPPIMYSSYAFLDVKQLVVRSCSLQGWCMAALPSFFDWIDELGMQLTR